MGDSARRISVLSKVAALAGMLEYDEVLAAVARLSIPEFADWCIVDVVEDRELRRVEVALRDPARAALAVKLRRILPPTDDPALHELLAGRPIFLPEYTDALAAAHAWSAEIIAIAQEIGVRSLLLVPLVARDAVVGVLTFAMTWESGRRYGEEDLAVAQELARRAAAVVENARLHRELRRSEQRFRVALAHTHVSVFETDRELRYTWVYNPMFGLEQKDLIGKASSDLSRSDDAAYFASRKRAVLETGEHARVEIQLDVGGAARHCIVHMEPLRGPSGDIVGITGAATDVTEQKLVQEKLADALTFREQMVSVLAHDLRNPASSALMVASALLRVDLADRTRTGILEIRNAARRMLEMIESLLDFSESRFRGGLSISPVATDLHEVTRAVVQEVLAANPGRRIDLALGADGRGRWDPARMAQVVSNLVANAIAHGAPGEPVRISLDGGAEELRLCVWNAGSPIPRELFPVLFEPFRRGAASRGRGLGLGLYIVKQIVTAHGGDIEVRSTDEEGTTFTLRVPRWKAVSHGRPAREDGAG